MDFGSHTVGVVDQAAALVNAIVPGEARGRAYPAADGIEELRSRVDSVLGTRRGRGVTAEEARGMAEVAEQLRAVFRAAAAQDIDQAAGLLNELAVRHDARPVLQRHDGEPWHLHFHGPDAGVVAGNGGAMAVGLAYVLGSEHADRIGVCCAPGCDRVYVDVSRNGTKRFCSTACQNRVKTATFRSRQAAAR